ncbi:MAG: hypothetical protein GY866_30465, partial [Proteobacteria bacterium]|nr:hypothetical protein [Pseudomonadota bacterium]
DANKIEVAEDATPTEFKFLDYPKLIDLLNALEAKYPTATITKDVTVSDNLSTVKLFDHVSSQTIVAEYTVKADLKQLFDWLDKTLPDAEATLESTATTMVEDFDLTLSGGTSGTDPDATQWGLVYAALAEQKLAVTVPICDGLPAPYDSTLTAAIAALDETHAVNMSAAEKRGKKRQSFVSAHGGYGWSGGYVAPPTADECATLNKQHNSEYSQFFGFGVNAFNYAGVEYEQLPCYFAVQAASMFLGGLASRVLTSQYVSAVKATNDFNEADRRKLHEASVIFPTTDNKGTYVNRFYTTWKSTPEPMKTVPSRIRCAMLSDNDIARKLESWMTEYQGKGISPQKAEGVRFIQRILETHKQGSVNWVSEFGDIDFSFSGIKFDYTVHELQVPVVPEFGFGTVEVLNT